MGRNELENDPDGALARLSAATEAMAPDERLTDGVMGRIAKMQSASDPLAAIARATQSMDPGDAFAGAVMARVTNKRRPVPAPSWLDGVVRSGPMAVGLAAIAAAASFLIFTSSQSDVDTLVASSVDTVEVDE